jgi:hypothetical protein
MNTNGAARAGVKEDYKRENIFLFWPNIIGKSQSSAFYRNNPNILQAILESCSHSRHYITCLFTLEPAPSSTAYPASSMHLMAMPRDTLNSRQSLAQFWIW